ncbi:MAG TPA: AmmeMemoRadiSam system protein B [Sulfurimonas sp. UBA12504]|nr:MAG: AmmeMemoRadiSam system protein B [Sulfurimonas sp. GWF2_37_8]DAB29743.1 MAG TPA: AmmeMemoRadiSam system protein B [Sulfurimonas sp. UBA12504]
MKRNMSVAGTFYPANSTEIKRYFTHFSALYDERKKLPQIKPRAIIVPHAGYVYSGYTADIAYRMLQNAGIKTVIVLGPSHRVAFEGVSLGKYESYETPFGAIEADEIVTKEIAEEFELAFIEQAHAEHSTEVQFPFIKYYLPDVRLIELVYSDATPFLLSKIIEFVLEKKDCGVIISTDLSHFYTQQEANQLDNICLNAIENLDLKALHKGCEACGKTGVEAMLQTAIKMELQTQLLDYRTSADVSGDMSRVVGYASACFMDKN